MLALRVASAGDQRVRFAWVRGDEAGGCLDQQEVEKGVIARLGHNPFSPDGALRIEGFVDRTGRTWRADIRVRDERGDLVGRRALDTVADDCGPIGDAVVLAVALVIDPNAASLPPARATASMPPVDVAPARPAAAPCPVTPPCTPAAPCPACLRQESPQERVDAGLRVLGMLGILPRAAFGAGLSGSYARGAAEALASFSWLPDIPTDDNRFAFGFVAGTVGGCYGVALAEGTTLGGCGELAVGAIRATVTAVDQLTPLDAGEHLWLGAIAGPRLAVRAGAFRFEAGVGPILRIVGKQFTISPQKQPVFESPPVGGVAYLGVGIGAP